VSTRCRLTACSRSDSHNSAWFSRMTFKPRCTAAELSACVLIILPTPAPDEILSRSSSTVNPFTRNSSSRAVVHWRNCVPWPPRTR